MVGGVSPHHQMVARSGLGGLAPQQLRMQPMPQQQQQPAPRPMLPSPPGLSPHPMQQRRPLLLQGPLLQEQPLLLEELLEQEKREQERQQAAQAMQQTPHEHVGPGAAAPETSGQLLSDVEFERLRAEVLSTPTSGGSPSGLSPPAMPVQGTMPMLAGPQQLRPPFSPAVRPMQPQWGDPSKMAAPRQLMMQQQQVQQPMMMQQPQPVVMQEPSEFQFFSSPRYTKFVLYFPYMVSVRFDCWLQNLSSKQRQLRKSNQELGEVDAMELDRITRELTGLAKQLEQRLPGEGSETTAAASSDVWLWLTVSPLSSGPPSQCSSPPVCLALALPLSGRSGCRLGTAAAVSHALAGASLSGRSWSGAESQHRGADPDESPFSPSPGAPMSSPQGGVQRLASPQSQLRMSSPHPQMGRPQSAGQPQFAVEHRPQPQQFSEQMRMMMSQRFVRNEPPQGNAGNPSMVMGPGPRPRMAAAPGAQGQINPMYSQQQQQPDQNQMYQQQLRAMHQQQNFQAQQMQQQRMNQFQQQQSPMGSPQQQMQMQQQQQQ
ncbi:hypothetical protein B566_EDAN010930, partial [Ephemera danica]